MSPPSPEAVSEKKPIPTAVRDNIMSHLPSLRNPLFRLDKAADHLENWVNGALDLEPLLDVSALLDEFISLVLSFTTSLH